MLPILQLQGLQTGYLDSRLPVVISQELNLDLHAGELVMLMGPNGSGKSTLLHTIAGLLPPLAGQINLSGQAISELSLPELACQMSLVLTERLPTDYMSVYEVVSLGRAPHTNFFGTLSTSDRAQVRHCLELCQLTALASRPFSRLSDGEKARTLIARALAQETPLILLDEPTAHLDLVARLEVVRMLRQIARELGKGILISTHELELAQSWADTLWLMGRGGEVFAGAPEDLALAGHLERIFGGEHVSYDLAQGRFLLKQAHLREIYLHGEGTYAQWVARALLRAGYATLASPSSACPEVHCSEQGWHLQLVGGRSAEGTSIAELLALLTPAHG